MAPWDEMGYFQIPQIRFIILLPSAQFKLDADPRRIWLSFATTGSVILTCQPEDATEGASNTPGFALHNNVPPLIFRQKDDAFLPQLAWFVSNPSAVSSTFSISQVLLKEWPAPRKEGPRQ